MSSPQEYSTIFSAPAEHNDKKPPKKPLLKRLLATLLAVCLIAGVTVAVVKLIPEKARDDNTDSSFEVINIDSANIATAEVIEDQNKIIFVSELVEGESKSETVWQVSGTDKDLTDSDKIKSAVESASKINAIKIIEGNIADYGLEAPKLTINFTAANAAFENFSVLVGNTAPAGLGYYCKISNKDAIYLVDNDFSVLFSCSPLDFADTTGISGIEQTTENADCFSDGSLVLFDYIKLSGQNYNGLTIVPQTDEKINSYFAYKITSPSVRIGSDTAVNELLTIATNGIASSGAYCFNPTAADIAKYKLNNPYATFEISVKGKVYTIKAAKVDDTYFAVMANGDNMIHKIPAASVSFASGQTTDYYSSFIILENLSGLSGFNVAFQNGQSYNFKTEYNNENESYKAYLGDSELDIENFKKLYRQFIELTPAEYDSKAINGAALTINLVHSDGTPNTVVEFKVYSPQRYQVELDGIPMGLITASTYEKFAQNIKNTAQGNPVAE
ncbi:MAG: DUF4340 domain-containing protein [Clostridia bacterium]|nr:DUF4340 domain-containing protein [Clostridia bacterium]